MPRHRKAARAFVSGGENPSVADMKRRYKNPFTLLRICVTGNYASELPSPEDRQAFAEAFPEDHYGMFGFFACDSDERQGEAREEG